MTGKGNQKMKPMDRLSDVIRVRFSPQLKTRLSKASKRLNRTSADIIRTATEDFLDFLSDFSD